MESEGNMTHLQNIAVRALKEVAAEHLVPNIARLNVICKITNGILHSGGRTKFYITLDGDCHIEANVSIHTKQGNSYLVTIFVLYLRRPNEKSTINPYTSFEIILTH